MIVTLIRSASAPTESPEIFAQRTTHNTGVVQVAIDGTASVKIQGRCDADAPWVDIKEYTESGADMVALFPRMRAVVESVSGEVSAWLAK